MRKFNLMLILLLFGQNILSAQHKHEREYRILKSQFPEKALKLISEKLEDARKIRFYKETDSSKISYEAKFKKDRLRYSVEFSKEGTLEDIEILIKPIDIPDATFREIETYLHNTFSKYRIRRLQQQYPATAAEPAETTIKNAFQNLMLTTINYEIVVSGKKDAIFEQFELQFDATGNFISIRKSLPPNYDHVLY